MRRLALLLALASCRADSPAPAPAQPVAPTPAPIAAAPAAPIPADRAPLGPLPTDVHPRHEALALTIDPAAAGYSGRAWIDVHLDQPRDHIWLHGRGLTVHSVKVSGVSAPATYEQVDDSGVARITLPAPMTGDLTIELAFDAAYDPQLVGVYKTHAAVYSKFEAIYARRAFPCFDEPRFKIPFDIVLTVPDSMTAIGNMPGVESAATSGHKQVKFATTPPLPTYLVAFAIGAFDAPNTVIPANAVRARPLVLGGIALAGHGGDIAYALADEPKLLAAEERFFGIAFPYPKLDLIAVPDFQSGAMENAGAITFRDSLLLDDPKISGLSHRIDISSVMAHETVHQWFGDLVTMAWWNDLWLNEGFATFLATKTMMSVHPEYDADLDAVDHADGVMASDSLASARRVRQPIESTHDITNAFDGITYEKGAAFLAMLEHYLGTDAFQRGVQAYLRDHALANATTDDLVSELAKASGKDVAPIATSFLDQPGVPNVDVQVACSAAKATLTLTQSKWRAISPAIAAASTVADPTWTIPVCVRTGRGANTSETCTLLTEHTGTIELASCPDWVMPNADAVGYYRFSLARDELAKLRDVGTKHLSTGERLALANDLSSGFDSGTIPAADVLRALEPLARDPHGTVAVVPLELLGLVDRYMAGAHRETLRARIMKMYAPRIAALTWNSSPTESRTTRKLRSRLYTTAALQLEDRTLLAEAARRGREIMMHGVTKSAMIGDPDLAAMELAAVARTGDAKVFDALVAALFGSDDAELRNRILGALANVRDPALVTRALDLSLDSKLRTNERSAIPMSLLRTIETRDAAWAWLTAHFDQLAPMLPDRFAGFFPRLYAACDAQRIEAIRAFFTPRVDKLTGGPRNLAQALEGDAQCMAKVAAQQTSVDAYLTQLK
jgi:cytosol alanyl aminopeptidase